MRLDNLHHSLEPRPQATPTFSMLRHDNYDIEKVGVAWGRGTSYKTHARPLPT